MARARRPRARAATGPLVLALEDWFGQGAARPRPRSWPMAASSSGVGRFDRRADARDWLAVLAAEHPGLAAASLGSTISADDAADLELDDGRPRRPGPDAGRAAAPPRARRRAAARPRRRRRARRPGRSAPRRRAASRPRRLDALAAVRPRPRRGAGRPRPRRARSTSRRAGGLLMPTLRGDARRLRQGSARAVLVVRRADRHAAGADRVGVADPAPPRLRRRAHLRSGTTSSPAGRSRSSVRARLPSCSREPVDAEA